jgi:hypothetical protein
MIRLVFQYLLIVTMGNKSSQSIDINTLSNFSKVGFLCLFEQI